MALVRLTLKASVDKKRKQALLSTLQQNSFNTNTHGSSLMIWLDDDDYWQSSAKLFQLAFKFTDVTSLPEVVKRDLSAKAFLNMPEDSVFKISNSLNATEPS